MHIFRVYPIRQKEFKIPYFYREFRKCFLLHYPTKNGWPHLSFIHQSRIFINISNAKYYNYSFYIEDGFSFPKIQNVLTDKSVLHDIQIIKRRPREGCIQFDDGRLKSKDDFIQNCIIEKTKNEFNAFPMNSNLIINETMSYSLSKLKFINNSEINFYLKECERKYSAEECYSVHTKLSHKNIYGYKDISTIILTPFQYLKEPFEDENLLIVLNRVLSFLILFTGVSVKEFLKTFILGYFIRLSYDLELFKRIFYLFLFLLYSIHFCFLFYNIINHSFIDVLSLEFSDNLNDLPKLRACFELEQDLSLNNYTLEYLLNNTMNISDVLEKITLFDEDNAEAYNYTSKNFTYSFYQYFFLNGSKIDEKTFNDFEAPDHFNTIYSDNFKCFSFKITPLKTGDNIKMRYLNLHRLVQFDFKLENKRPVIFFDPPSEFNFSWNNTLNPADYIFQLTKHEKFYHDDYWYLKNIPTTLKRIVGLSKIKDTIYKYITHLSESFRDEQYALNTMTPLLGYKMEGYTNPIKNRQFNFFIQFRSIATTKNDNYDFQVNTKAISLTSSYYVQRKLKESKNLRIIVNLDIIKFKENVRNRYRYIELFFHLFVCTSFWFKIDFIGLPVTFKKAYPFFKCFGIYFLYYFVSFLIFLFESWYAFIRFMKFKNA